MSLEWWDALEGLVPGSEEDLERWKSECDCGSGMTSHKFGEHESCEYYRHHCTTCHERKVCTIAECKTEFLQKIPIKENI